MKKLLVTMIIILIAAGCGIKGDPLPPAEQQTIQAAQEIKTEAPTQDQNLKKPGTKKK